MKSVLKRIAGHRAHPDATAAPVLPQGPAETIARTIRKIECIPRRLTARIRKKVRAFEERLRELPQRRFM